MQQSPSWKAHSSAASQYILGILRNPKTSLLCSQSPPRVLILSIFHKNRAIFHKNRAAIFALRPKTYVVCRGSTLRHTKLSVR